MSKVILVPLDGSEVAASILQQVVALARSSEARLMLLTVGLPLTVPPSQTSEMPLSRTFQAEAYLDHICAYLTNEGLEVSTMVCMGDPATEILRCIAAGRPHRHQLPRRRGISRTIPGQRGRKSGRGRDGPGHRVLRLRSGHVVHDL